VQARKLLRLVGSFLLACHLSGCLYWFVTPAPTLPARANARRTRAPAPCELRSTTRANVRDEHHSGFPFCPRARFVSLRELKHGVTQRDGLITWGSEEFLPPADYGMYVPQARPRPRVGPCVAPGCPPLLARAYQRVSARRRRGRRRRPRAWCCRRGGSGDQPLRPACARCIGATQARRLTSGALSWGAAYLYCLVWGLANLADWTTMPSTHEQARTRRHRASTRRPQRLSTRTPHAALTRLSRRPHRRTSPPLSAPRTGAPTRPTIQALVSLLVLLINVAVNAAIVAEVTHNLILAHPSHPCPS
jgi:hypothetical protein